MFHLYSQFRAIIRGATWPKFDEISAQLLTLTIAECIVSNLFARHNVLLTKQRLLIMEQNDVLYIVQHSL